MKIYPGKEGLVHISQLDERRLKSVDEVVKVGDLVLVKVIGIDKLGRLSLSRKEALNVTYSRKAK